MIKRNRFAETGIEKDGWVFISNNLVIAWFEHYEDALIFYRGKDANYNNSDFYTCRILQAVRSGRLGIEDAEMHMRSIRLGQFTHLHLEDALSNKE